MDGDGGNESVAHQTAPDPTLKGAGRNLDLLEE